METSRLSASVRGLAATLIELAQVRLELLSVEAQEEVLRVAGLLAYGAIALVCLALGLGFLAILITVALWDTHRMLALAVFAVADVITVMVNGAVLESGDPAAIRASRTVQEAYLGEGVAG